MYKHLGMSSEQVCAIGKWKNSTAFAQHYLRLNALGNAQEKLHEKLHKVSSGIGAEPDWLCTILSANETIGNNQEGEAPRQDET
jgi:hypothetical protein